MKLGTERTKQFYDQSGWTTDQAGTSVDGQLFGTIEDGPIRQEISRLQIERTREAIGRNVHLLEAGCGGNPAEVLLDLCASYTGADFSALGIDLARERMKGSAIPCRLEVADITALPFADNSFDAAHCAHVLYHIDSAAGQAAAMREMLRVVRPGGVVVLLVANPFPLLAPLRAAARLVASIPVLSDLLRAMRKPSPLPYRPHSIGWMRRQLRGADVRVITAGIASTAFNRRVPESYGIGRLAWLAMRWLEREHPALSAYLGSFVQIEARKR
jgi:SAM-dependent methyltransferase